MARRRSAETPGRPSACAREFCCSIASRTAGRPPRRSCSPTGSSPGPSSARMALRWRVDCWSFGRAGREPGPGPRRGGLSVVPNRCSGPAAGRSARSKRRSLDRRSDGLDLVGGPSPVAWSADPSSWRSPGRPPWRSPGRPPWRSPGRPPWRSPGRPPWRSPGRPPWRSPGRDQPARPGCPFLPPSESRVGRFAPPSKRTPSAGREDPLTSMRSGPSRSSRVAGTSAVESTRIPSMPVSTSALRTAPTMAPAGKSAPSTVPRGSRAPGARHVQDPSSR
jgi:hypothetical protein